MSETGKSDRLDIYLVAGGKYHNIDYARLELLKLFAEQPRLKIQVGADYSQIDEICAADFIVTYTCDVIPTAAETATLATARAFWTTTRTLTAAMRRRQRHQHGRLHRPVRQRQQLLSAFEETTRCKEIREDKNMNCITKKRLPVILGFSLLWVRI